MRLNAKILWMTGLLVLFMAGSLISAPEEVEYKKKEENKERSFIPMKEASVIVEHEAYMEEKQNTIERLRSGSSGTFSLIKKLREEEEDEKKEQEYKPKKEKDEKEGVVVIEKIKEKRDKKTEFIRKKKKETKKEEKKTAFSVKLEWVEDEELEMDADKKEKDQQDGFTSKKDITISELEVDYRAETVRDPRLVKRETYIPRYVIRQEKSIIERQQESDLPFWRDASLYPYIREEHL